VDYYKYLQDGTTISCNDATNVQISSGMLHGNASIHCTVEQMRRLGMLLQQAADDIIRQSVAEGLS
jgi:hypothetical protein